MWELISINWTGQAFSAEQMLVLRNVAAKYLRQGKKTASLAFSHLLCEGLITRRRDGTFGTFSGTFFHADLGTVKGERWTCDFLLPRGSEHIILNEDSVVVSSRAIKGGDYGAKQVDVILASDGDVTPSQKGELKKPRPVTRETVI